MAQSNQWLKQADQFKMIASDHTDQEFIWTTDPEERKKLWKRGMMHIMRPWR